MVPVDSSALRDTLARFCAHVCESRMRGLNAGTDANECLDTLDDARALEARLAQGASAVAIPGGLIEDAQAYLAEVIENVMYAIVEGAEEDECLRHLGLVTELVPALFALAGGSWTWTRAA